MTSRALRAGVAYVQRDTTGGARIPFTSDGVEYRVAVGAVRHLGDKCPAAARVSESSVVSLERVRNDAELAAKTARCTGGCWDKWERDEQKAIVQGDERKRIDWEEDGVRGRRRLARWIREGLVDGEIVGPLEL